MQVTLVISGGCNIMSIPNIDGVPLLWCLEVAQTTSCQCIFQSDQNKAIYGRTYKRLNHYNKMVLTSSISYPLSNVIFRVRKSKLLLLNNEKVRKLRLEIGRILKVVKLKLENFLNI